MRDEEETQSEFNADKTLSIIRENCVEVLEKQGVESPQVFLVSSFGTILCPYVTRHLLYNALPNKRASSIFVKHIQLILLQVCHLVDKRMYCNCKLQPLSSGSPDANRRETTTGGGTPAQTTLLESSREKVDLETFLQSLSVHAGTWNPTPSKPTPPITSETTIPATPDQNSKLPSTTLPSTSSLPQPSPPPRVNTIDLSTPSPPPYSQSSSPKSTLSNRQTTFEVHHSNVSVSFPDNILSLSQSPTGVAVSQLDLAGTQDPTDSELHPTEGPMMKGHHLKVTQTAQVHSEPPLWPVCWVTTAQLVYCGDWHTTRPRSQPPRNPSIPQPPRTFTKYASQTFPRASIYIPLINYSPHLTPAQTRNILYMNNSLTKHHKTLQPIPQEAFRTGQDHIHWTSPTAQLILDSWCGELHF
ncbi:hypothetical protein NQZ68_027850 [Dissostichus eleginoides]|nr:hypothetical protein NQZ68_027850 [Dissostichus eleginoides]